MTINDITPIYSESDDPLVLTPATARQLLADTGWRRYAVIGDSIAAGIGDPWPGYADVSWADRVADALGSRPDSAYLNTGRMGATILDVETEQLGSVLDFRPDLVHISCGGNDLFLHGADPHDVEDDLDTLCSMVATTGATLSMFTLADVFVDEFRSLRPRFIEFADIVRRVAARYDAVLTEFWDHPARLRGNWLSADHIHLTMAGQAVVASEVARSLAAYRRDR